MRSKYINSSCCRKYITESEFSDIAFLNDAKLLAVRRRFFTHFRNFSLRMRSIDRITTSALKFDVIYEFIAPICIKTRSFWERDTIFGDFRDVNVCVCTVSTLILLPVANFVTGNGFSYPDVL